jgi:hypothetical protein
VRGADDFDNDTPRYERSFNPANAAIIVCDELSRLCLAALRTAAGELLSTDDIAGLVIAAKSFDKGDGILRAAIRDQVGSIIKRLQRQGTVYRVGNGRAARWSRLA